MPVKYTAYILLLFLIFTGLNVTAQEYFQIYGRITDEQGKPIELANISAPEYKTGTYSDKKGKYKLQLIAGREVTIVISFLGYTKQEKKVKGKPGEKKEMNFSLAMKYDVIKEVDIEGERERSSTLVRVNPKVITVMPDISGGFESVLKAFPGVSKSNELSSQYSVRGGNFDENLVYVNDIEIYRPFLIRSGQQEGLSFVNTNMVSSVLFSAGGFESKYGDKMSSVLDIKYKKPVDFAGTVSLSLLGGTVNFEGASDNHRFTHITGVRYKTTSYVLNTLDVQGDYKPRFTDIQTYMTWDMSDEFEIAVLGNFAQNRYNFIPEDRITRFGSIQDALMLKIYFDGQEVDRFNTATGAITGSYHPHEKLDLKFITSAYMTDEIETFDIQGQYYLNEIDKQLGSESMGDSVMNIGIGTYLNHARNYLNATVLNASHRGYLETETNHYLQWGVKYQHELINDDMTEWRMLDSAGHSLPFPDTIGYASDQVYVSEYIIADNTIESDRITGYFQDIYSFEIDSAEFSITAGVRANYWSLNNQTVVSPRGSFSYIPNWKRDVLFRFATGLYYQPPFYKEIKDLEGNINTDIKAQRSIHFVLGYDYNFTAWSRPFKYITEIYYKDFDNLIPYLVDNVRIRYYGENNAHGYAAGIDMKVNGEFVKGVDSWASLSVMQTEEDIEDDYYYDGNNELVEPGYIPRPTDQRVNFGLFFQDYIPNNPSYKMHLSLLFGSRLPFGPPNTERYKHIFRMSPYRRVDLGFSKVLKSESKVLPESNPFRHFKSLWLSLEFFNLLDIKNTISYTWITDVTNMQYAVPNYLTSRRINLKLIAKF